MSVKIKFEPNWEYQERAIEAVCSLFEGQEREGSALSVQIQRPDSLFSESSYGNRLELQDADMLVSLQQTQEKNGVLKSASFDCEKLGEVQHCMDFTVEMETGTGKTYVYLRTVCELYRRYGFKKFMIVVPSLAIREGVYESILSMSDHLKMLYPSVPALQDVSSVYRSGQTHEIKQFALADELRILICTTSIIQTTNNLHSEREGGKLVHDIQRLRPIVIVDEPQNVGEKGEEGITSLNPLCTLRYSATHKNLFHPLYALNAIDAAEQKLVKGIQVDSGEDLPDISVHETGDKRGKNFVKLSLWGYDNSGELKLKKYTLYQNARLSEKTKNPEMYGNIYIARIEKAFVEFSIDGVLKQVPVGESLSSSGDDRHLVRQMVRSTIEHHLEKELALSNREKGDRIKVLTLFFIDNVPDYRVHGKGQVQAGWLSGMFEEEYQNALKNEKYKDLPSFDSSLVHNGYFSADYSDRKLVSGTESPEQRRVATACQDILKNKGELLSPDNPLRFIFTHSALKEGWDNPNVFQICVLRDMKKTITRRQALGRGLRICVNESGVRVRDEGINVLTVVSRENFKIFARELQKDMAEDGIVFGKLLVERLGAISYADAKGNQVQLGQDKAAAELNLLQERGWVRADGTVTTELREALKSNEYETAPENADAKEAIVFALNKLTSGLMPKRCKERKTVVAKPEILNSPEFAELWQKVCTKTTYRVKFDTDKLIERSIEALNRDLEQVQAQNYVRQIAEIQITEGGVESGKPSVSRITCSTADDEIPDLLTRLAEATQLCRRTLGDILLGTKHLKKVHENPRQFLKVAISTINSVLMEVIREGIYYEPVKIGNKMYEAMQVFRSTEFFEDKLIKGGENCLTNFVAYDSEIERKFADDSANTRNVKMYAKLPSKSLRIQTPVGYYSPDWVMIVEHDGINRLYFVVETKGTDDEKKLHPDEQTKIACARAHFKFVGSGVHYLAPRSNLMSVLKS